MKANHNWKASGYTDFTGCVSKVIRAMFESKSQPKSHNVNIRVGCVSKVIRAMFESKSQPVTILYILYARLCIKGNKSNV